MKLNINFDIPGDNPADFSGVAYLSSNKWVFLFLGLQAVLIAYLLVFNIGYDTHRSLTDYFFAVVPQVILMLVGSLVVIKKIGVDFRAAWLEWSAGWVKDLRLILPYLAGCLAFSWLLGLTGYPWSGARDDSGVMILDALNRGPAAFTTLLMLLCVAAPVAEELFFRRLLYVGVRQEMGAVRAILLCSLLFALVHTATTVLVVFGWSLAAFYMYEKHKRVFANIALHASLNLITVLLKVFG